MNTPTTAIPKSVPVKYRNRIQHWDDERGIGNSLIVSLADGWHWAGIDHYPGNHVEGFDTVAEVIYQLRQTRACDCSDCRLALSSLSSLT